jgi:hypothetical protein
VIEPQPVPDPALPARVDDRPAEDSAPLDRAGPAQPLALGGDLPSQVKLVRDLSAVRPGTVGRRALFMWLRIFVDESKPGGKHTRVHVRVPLPIPLLGLLLPLKMSPARALAALADAHAAPDGPTALQRSLNAHMAFELVHVEETNPRTGKRELVVIGVE